MTRDDLLTELATAMRARLQHRTELLVGLLAALEQQTNDDGSDE